LQLPFFTVLSFCFVVPPILKRIVREKESGVKVISSDDFKSSTVC